jgi:hypothetical protein
MKHKKHKNKSDFLFIKRKTSIHRTAPLYRTILFSIYFK